MASLGQGAVEAALRLAVEICILRRDRQARVLEAKKFWFQGDKTVQSCGAAVSVLTHEVTSVSGLLVLSCRPPGQQARRGWGLR